MGNEDQSASGLSDKKVLGTRFGSTTPEDVALIEALAEEEVERLKTRLFRALAHELRTPLASLRLAAGLLVQAPPADASPEHLQLFQVILQSSDRLDLLLSSLLDYARLQTPHLQLDLHLLDLRLLLESVAALLAPHIQSKRQTLTLQLPADPVSVRGDPLRLRTALHALLETAWKRCPAGGTLRLGCRTQEDDAVLGWVCDTGPAVPAATREAFLTDSAWLPTDDVPTLAPFGLGLPLAQDLLARHGGSLWLAEPDAPEEGLCLHFRLPLAPAEPGRSTPEKGPL